MRINQLILPDETVVGLCLAVVYMLMETQRPYLGGGILASLGIPPPASGVRLVALQLPLLIGFTAALAWFDRRSQFQRLGVRPAYEVDIPLAVQVEEIAKAMQIHRQISVLITENICDLNAYCVLSLRRPTIVLGGGFRLLLKKSPEAAIARIAHECAHLRQRDSFLMLTAWYGFQGFVCLAFLNAAMYSLRLAWNAAIWVSSMRHHEVAWGRVATTGSRWLFGELRAPWLFMFSVMLLGVIVCHLIRLREYRADEAAAQFGYRGPLVHELKRSFLRKSVISLRLRFHPDPSARVLRLLQAGVWGQLDFWFLASAGFVGEQIQGLFRLLPVLFDQEMPGPVDEPSTDAEYIKDILFFLTKPWMLAEISTTFLILGLILTHLVRVNANAVNWRVRLNIATLSTVACMVGVFVSDFVDWLTDAEFGAGLDFDGSLMDMFVSGSGVLPVTLGMAFVIPGLMRLKWRGGMLDGVRLMLACGVAGLALQALTFSIPERAMLLYGTALRRTHIPGLPALSKWHFISPSGVWIGALLLGWLTVTWLAGMRGNLGFPAVRRIHPSRLSP